MATASTIIKTASNEIGVKETGNNNVKYNTEYYGKAVNGDAYPWCAVFVWWVFKHSGASSIFYGGGKTASVYEIWRYYNSLGRVYSSPKVGDLAIITTSAGGTYGHVGIVKSVSGNTYVTIDGNSKDQVRTTNRTVGSPKASFCRPAYGSGSGSSTNLSMGSSGTDVKDMQKKLIALGYSCGSSGADGSFGQGTYNAVCNFQRDHGLTVDGVIGPTTRSKINSAYSNLGGSSSGTNLSMGSSGTDVKNMQKKLIALGYSCGSSGADGIFGQGTYNAVCKFQKANGLSVDGIIGPATRAKIMLYMQNCKMVQDKNGQMAGSRVFRIYFLHLFIDKLYGINGVLKKREILKKDYIWAAVYVAGIGQYGNYPDDYLHDVEICQSFAC